MSSSNSSDSVMITAILSIFRKISLIREREKDIPKTKDILNELLRLQERLPAREQFKTEINDFIIEFSSLSEDEIPSSELIMHLDIACKNFYKDIMKKKTKNVKYENLLEDNAKLREKIAGLTETIKNKEEKLVESQRKIKALETEISKTEMSNISKVMLSLSFFSLGIFVNTLIRTGFEEITVLILAIVFTLTSLGVFIYIEKK